MKKPLFFIYLILCSCSQFNTLSQPFTKNENCEEIAATKNENCEEIAAVKIFQVLDTFALALSCQENYSYSNGLSCYGLTVYVPKEEGKIYYDNQIIKPKAGKCISFDSTYQYESKDGNIHTVPILKFIND
ncbi:MAG: hypothetical protein IJY17_04945 [Alphaproteobacteria bacterium]|nr:hypothetical protein [Alphaproteobacteria bacterium]